MANDVAIKAISGNDIESGDIIVGVNKNGDYQRLDVTDSLGDPLDDDALSGLYYNRFDNPTYY